MLFIKIAVIGTYITRKYFQENWHPASDMDGQCPNMHRYGKNGDGGKMICDHDIQDKDFTLISIGSNNDFSFETKVHEKYPNSNIIVFDGTVRKPKNPSFLKYNKTNILVSNANYLNNFKNYILKMDCEGCEYDVLRLLNLQQVSQILLEVHGDNKPFSELKKLMKYLNKTHSIFYSEPNIQYSDGSCIEFSMKKRRKYLTI